MTRLPNSALLALAAIGFAIPNAFFLPWLVSVWPDVGTIFRDPPALAVLLDATIAMLWIAAHFAATPRGRRHWPWFIVLSFVGGLGLAIPLFLWWRRPSPAPAPR